MGEISLFNNSRPVLSISISEWVWNVCNNIINRLFSWSFLEVLEDWLVTSNEVYLRLISNICNDGNHLIIVKETNQSVTSMEECRTSWKLGKASLQCSLTIFVHCPVGIVTDSCDSSQVSHVWNGIAWFVIENTMLTNVLLMSLLVLSVGCINASLILVVDTVSPVIRSMLITIRCSIWLIEINNSFPCASHRWVKEGIIILSKACLELVVVSSIVFGSSSFKVCCEIIDWINHIVKIVIGTKLGLWNGNSTAEK